LFTKNEASGAIKTGASPKPETTMPAIRPVFADENHFSAAGVVAEYPKPIPVA